jgi:hypothetical protein
MGVAKVKRSYIARTGGAVSRHVPRMYNQDRGVEIYGYAEVNLQATSVLGRVKIHKAYLYCEILDVFEGDLILDRLDNKQYIVMSAKPEVQGYEVIYLDTTLIHCEDTITVRRFGTGVKDSFGRVAVATPQVVADNVPCMINPKDFSVVNAKDRPVAENQIQFYVQSKTGIKVADRLTTASHGKNYLVVSVDTESLRNIDILYTDLDVR